MSFSVAVNYRLGGCAGGKTAPVPYVEFYGVPKSAERSLWRAVILQALLDASKQGGDSSVQHCQRTALSWLFSNSDDFRDVCIRADLNPDYVRSKARMAHERGFVWRKRTFKEGIL